MIIDKIENLEKYLSTFKYGKELSDFIKNTDFSTLSYGKTQIVGKDLFVNYMTYTTKNTVGDLEAHKDYVDLQLVFKGEERMDYANLDDCTTTVEYNQEKDVYFLTAKDYSSLYFKEGYFAIYFPQDAHRPSLTYKEEQTIVKAVFKIKV